MKALTLLGCFGFASCTFMANTVNHHNHPNAVRQEGGSQPVDADAPAWEDSTATTAATDEEPAGQDDPTGEMGRATVDPPRPLERITNAITGGP